MKVLRFQAWKPYFTEATLKQELVGNIILLISSLSMFYIGMHNLDLGQNMRYIEGSVNTWFATYNINETYTLTDRAIGSTKDVDARGVYVSGFTIVHLGIFLVIYSSFVLGRTIERLKEQ